MKHTGAICIMAFPEEFVTMIPAWYRKPMEWIGMVNNGKTCVGHAAMALINKENGEIFYADFGRYITPFGYGRTRMKKTDPDVEFSYRVEFDETGKIKDKLALFQHFYAHPEKTHGGEVMFVSLNQEIDFDACFSFISDMNHRGSIIYDPFGKSKSNCSRFVYDSILAGMGTRGPKRKLKFKSPITPSPLANVFHGTEEEAYEFTPKGYQKVEDTSLRKIISYFFKKPPENAFMKDVFNPLPHMSFLGGIGDQAYFYMDEIIDGNKISVTKLDKNGNFSFTHVYQIKPLFSPTGDFRFIHDCNALWITIEQNNQKIRLERAE